MEYCLPHAVLALLQEEDSPQIPKSYFVRSGTNSTKITLVYTRRRRRDKTSNPSSLTSFSSFSSPSSLKSRIDNNVFRHTSIQRESPGLLRFQDSKNKAYQIQRSASVIECSHKVESSRFYLVDERASSLGLSRGGKMARSSFVASRSENSSGASSSSSTDDYSNLNSHQQHQQKQRQLPHQEKEIFTNSSISNLHKDRKRNLDLGLVSRQHLLSSSSNQMNRKDATPQASGNRPTYYTQAEEQKVKELKEQNMTHPGSPTPRYKCSPTGDDSCSAATLGGARRNRSDSHNSRRTCVSTPGRGYGDSARVRGVEDLRARGFSRAVAKTDPRRNSLSPRGGMDVCDNFRVFEHNIDDQNEHLTISHNSTPRSDRSSNDHQHSHPQPQQEDLHPQPRPAEFSSETTHSKATKNSSLSPRRSRIEDSSWSSLSPRAKNYKDRPTKADSPATRGGKNETEPLVSPRSPRPPTPNVQPVSTPAPCSSPSHRHSPAPYLSPSRQSTFEYDDDHAHLNDRFSPPPTPCLRGCVGSEEAVESFNSSVKIRLGAQLDNLMTGKVSRASTPKPWRSTSPPSTMWVNPPTPATPFTESRHSPVRGVGSTYCTRPAK